MKTLFFILGLFAFAKPVEQIEVKLSYNQNQVLKKSYELDLFVDGKQAEVIKVQRGKILFSNSELIKEGSQWIYLVDGKQSYIVSHDFRKVYDLDNKLLFKSNYAKQNSRKWYNLEKGNLHNVVNIDLARKGVTTIKLNTTQVDDMTRIILMERVIFSRNTMLSIFSGAAF